MEYVGSRVSRIEPLGRRRKERPKRRLMAVVMEDMRVGWLVEMQSKMETDDPLR